MQKTLVKQKKDRNHPIAERPGMVLTLDCFDVDELRGLVTMLRLTVPTLPENSLKGAILRKTEWLAEYIF